LIHFPHPQAGERLSQVMSGALAQLTQLPVPVIAAVNGDAVGGGCEIMTACDLRLAAENAIFRFAQINVGLTTGWGGTARLVHLLGVGRAMELLLTGRKFDAAEALAMGFVHRLTAPGQVMNRAQELAETLRALPRQGLAANKRLAWKSADLSLEEAYQLETTMFAKLWPTADHLEAMAAFNEKRPPEFGNS
jgi:enoyl-CoA hydratase